MTPTQIVAVAIRNVLADISRQPWETSIEKVLAMLAEEIEKFDSKSD